MLAQGDAIPLLLGITCTQARSWEWGGLLLVRGLGTQLRFKEEIRYLI